MTKGEPPKFNGEKQHFQVWSYQFENFLEDNDLLPIVARAAARGVAVVTEEQVTERDRARKRKLIAAFEDQQVGEKLLSLLGGVRPTDPSITFKGIWDRLVAYYDQKPSTILERFNLSRLRKRSDQPFEDFLAAVTRQVSQCNFVGDSTHTHANCKCECDYQIRIERCKIRDCVVIGHDDRTVQQKLLETENLDYDKCLQICRAMELASRNVEQLYNTAGQGGSSGEVHAFQDKRKFGKQGQGASRGESSVPQKQGQQQQQFHGSERKKECFRCGSTRHSEDKCPFRNQECYACGAIGHTRLKCPKNRNLEGLSNTGPKHRVHGLEQGDSESDPRDFEPGDQEEAQMDSLYATKDSSRMDDVDELSAEQRPSGNSTEGRGLVRKYYEKVSINGNAVRMQIDSGATMSVIGKGLWRALGSPRLVPTKRRATAYNGGAVAFFGRLVADIAVNGRRGRECRRLSLYVTEREGSTPTFGLEWFPHLHLDWSKIAAYVERQSDSMIASLTGYPSAIQSLFDKYQDLFDGNPGTLKHFKCTLHLKPGAVPKFFRARPVPHKLREKVELELERLQERGIIIPVEASDWATPIVIAEKKDGRVRVCGDFRLTLNSQLIVDQYPLPNIDELCEKMAGGEEYSKVDMHDCFLQMPMEEESSKLVVINTHKGLFKYLKMPFGIAPAPAIMQRTIEQMTRELKGVGAFIDDFGITGADRKEHLENLEELFKVARFHGAKFSKEKSDFFKPSIEYLGFVLSKRGRSANPKKTAAVRDAPRPTDQSQVRSFLGKVNTFHKFIPDLSTKTAPLNALLEKDRSFIWTDSCERSFQLLKDQLLSPPVLVSYKPGLPLFLATDASSYGISSVLFHRSDGGSEHPIDYVSRTLTDAEKNYSMVEKEALAVYYGVLKHYQYLWGQHFTLITDHKPLTTIFGPKKGLPQTASSRLTRWAIFLAGFHYDIEYRSSKQNAMADALSRLPLPVNCENEALLDELFEIRAIDWPDHPVSNKEVRHSTARDPILSSVMRFVQRGWPDKVTVALEPYFQKRSELICDQGCVLWGNRVVMPAQLQERFLQQLHDGHPGITRTKSLARDYVWWPGVDAAIENMVNGCMHCQAKQAASPESPIHPWELPSRPWQRLHIDFAGPIHNRMFLCVIDARTKWIEVILMQSATSMTTISALRKMFACFGLPDQVVSDNGPQFTSEEMSKFMASKGIRHSFVSAYHPRSNGQAENLVRTFKSAIGTKPMTSIELEVRLERFLTAYRNTVHATTQRIPAEMMFGKRVRLLLDRICPTSVEDTVQVAQKKLAESKTTKVRDFAMHDSVKVLRYNEWLDGFVTDCVAPLTYLVRVPILGRVMKVHVDHLQKRQMPCNENGRDADIRVEAKGGVREALIVPGKPTNVRENYVPQNFVAPTACAKDTLPKPEERRKIITLARPKTT